MPKTSVGLQLNTVAPPPLEAHGELDVIAAPSEKGRVNNLAVAAALIGLAVVSKWTEFEHIDRQLWSPLARIDTSMGHLAIGFIPTWLSVHLVDKWRESKIRKVAYGAATALATTVLLDAGVEAAQTLHTTEQFANPLSSANTPETVWDGFFALAGVGLYYSLNRRKAEKAAVAQSTLVASALPAIEELVAAESLQL